MMSMHGRWLMIAALGVCGLLAGCQKSLFAKDAPNSPYERYQLLRGEVQEDPERNRFVFSRPDLRGRLRPLDAE